MGICFPVTWRGVDHKRHVRHMEKHSRLANENFAKRLIQEYAQAKQADKERWDRSPLCDELSYRRNADSDALRSSVETCLEIMGDHYGEDAVADLRLELTRIDRPGLERFCASCGDRYTEEDIQELAEFGEKCYKGHDVFLCPDCYDAFTRLDLEDQEAYLLGLKKEALA